MRSHRTRGKVHELKHKRFLLNIRRHFSIVRVAERWDCGISILGVTKKNGHDPGHLGLDIPAWAAGLDQVASRVAFQPQPFYDSVIIILVKKQWTKKVKMAKARVSIVLRYFIVYLEIMKCFNGFNGCGSLWLVWIYFLTVIIFQNCHGEKCECLGTERNKKKQ